MLRGRPGEAGVGRRGHASWIPALSLLFALFLFLFCSALKAAASVTAETTGIDWSDCGSETWFRPGPQGRRLTFEKLKMLSGFQVSTLTHRRRSVGEGTDPSGSARAIGRTLDGSRSGSTHQRSSSQRHFRITQKQTETQQECPSRHIRSSSLFFSSDSTNSICL